MKKKIAITGGDGFIGKRVIEALKDAPNLNVISAVREIKSEHVDSENTHYVKLDINNSSDCANSFSILQAPDILINLAWEKLDDYNSDEHSGKILKNHYLFLSCMIEQGLNTLVNTGTCFEYGMVSGEIKEDVPTNPSNPYATAKDTLRIKLEHLRSKKSFNLNWLRLFYMYGEGQDQRTLFSQFIKACKNSEPVFNMSGGMQLRDYLRVEEVAAYIVNIALRESNLGEINICSGEPIKIAELVERWKGEFGYDIKLNLGYYPYLTHEPMDFWGSTLKLKNIS